MPSQSPIASIAAERCETCRFWRAWEGMGVCQRHPPQPTTVTVRKAACAEAVWPMTDRNDWCGEYQEQSNGQ